MKVAFYIFKSGLKSILCLMTKQFGFDNFIKNMIYILLKDLSIVPHYYGIFYIAVNNFSSSDNIAKLLTYLRSVRCIFFNYFY